MPPLEGLLDLPLFSGLLSKAYRLMCLPAYVDGFQDGLIVAGLIALVFFLLSWSKE